ncbi:MAG: galactokinase [Streptosporangiaceae bacterium]|jgi:galactokinase
MRGVWRAPGRANLMGEHTDYNGGLVLPFALSQVTTAAAVRTDGILELRSAQAPGEEARIAVEDLKPGSVTGWAAYPAGVAWALRTAGYQVPGASISFDSDVPQGSGLSSSAALEASTALALRDLGGFSVGRDVLATLCQRAENEFVGAPTGIMDQSASLRCEAGHALLLDCSTLETTQIPFDPASGGAAALVVDTRAHHAHTAGGYGSRRTECETAARQLNVPFLGTITSVAAADKLTDPILRRRARHVISDDNRVRLVVEALTNSRADKSDIYRDIGALLTEAHISLRDDFEISWPEANATVDAVLAAGGLGARMIGGGFGGSVLALIPVARVDAVRAAVKSAFAASAWPEPAFFDAIPSAGASRVP